ncbi:MAG: methyltransferase domain-containing protein [Candidatus Mcinerneyibacterium aminivorans]|jgi:predicted O-methyltransferase YrrM|uniref:Methyltransferase domain-containing protein n=1 Tax=Candidatus Mcinerneyibacterium aminivorans TaxID=2703815 RepID=A0A5D0MGD4_9BACT|nr:MAG: methyltransferase domain-containing protein [Candidatus Mcinerneyibacterium aminivorans]
MDNNIFYKENLLDFVNNFYKRFDKDLYRIIKSAESREGINPTVGKSVGRLLSFFTRMKNPDRVLELGTCIGVSTIIFAKNMSDNGEVVTIDIRADLLKEAIAHFKKFNIKPEKIKPVLGDINDVIPGLKKENAKFDIIFQDSAKKSYPRLLESLIEMLNPSGLLITDDVLLEKAHFPEHIKGINEALKEHNNMILEHKNLDSIFIPLEKGVIVSRKIK